MRLDTTLYRAVWNVLLMNCENRTKNLYYDKNSIDRSEEKSEGKIFMNCYTPMWSAADAAQKMFPVSAVFNTSVLDMSKEKHKRIYDLKMLTIVMAIARTVSTQT